MSDASITIHNLREKLLEEYADVALVALRQQAGLFISSDEYYKAKERIIDALRGITTV